jgi:predicted transcriptional regulator of viral defense system
MHGLTEQVPKTIYINQEQVHDSIPTGELTQQSIDAAFRRPVRVSRNVAVMKDLRICVISGKNTGGLGVIEEDKLDVHGRPVGKVRLTGIERTLIDIAVRPVYAGGVHEVLKAYRLAQGGVSVNRLAAMLKRLGYIYPYHQVIGFYLDRAGHKASSVDLLREFPREFDFYLTHKMAQTEYVAEWRLYVPKGF